MSKIQPETSFEKRPIINNVNLLCHEGFDQIKPEEIEILIKPTDTYSLHSGVSHQINNQLISHISIGDFEWLTGGIKIHSLADKNIGQFIQVRIGPTNLIVTGIEVEIKPNFWCEQGVKFHIPREGPLLNGITIGIEFCRNQNLSLNQINQVETINSTETNKP